MPINIKFKNKININEPECFALFCDEQLKIKGLDKLQIKKHENFIKKIVKSRHKTDKKISQYNINSEQSVIIIKRKIETSSTKNEIIGANFFDFIKNNNLSKVHFFEKNIESSKNKFFNEFLHGLNLKSYEFLKYKTKKSSKNFNITIIGNNKVVITDKNDRFNSLIEGINFTKDLVSEPGNVLHPDEYVKRISTLKKDGLKITILDEKELKKLGMYSLLGVGQGSVRGSYLACIEWKGAKNNSKPLAFVGKGVCFDTGGISLKPAKFMEDMTYDMAGSAVVVGLMKNLAIRKAKVNAVGVVGLVENMPGGNAQRPGDIVKSYSGKTIEILNTDAEGRLVLADALTYTEKKYKPKFIVDLATLTGAIIVSLGSEYAGLFSNNDKLSNQLYEAGLKVEEKVWRMPLNENYDKLINSKNADMQNINYQGGAGSTTAAQFLQRFILNKTPWAHLDIAGMAFSKYNGALNSWGATGFGVRLLNKLIEDNYE